MSPRGRHQQAPRSWIADGDDRPFSHADLHPDAPETARVGQAIARTLSEFLVGVNKAELERQTGVHRGTLKRIVDGDNYPDLHTLVALELYFNRALWPGRHS